MMKNIADMLNLEMIQLTRLIWRIQDIYRSLITEVNCTVIVPVSNW